MRLIAVSMVKNEADIIEPFCRHVAALADFHLIFDHHSTDGTSGILRRLEREGLPLTLFSDSRRDQYQGLRTTALMHRAVRDYAADWVLPLDADEFPQPGPPGQFRQKLAAYPYERPVALWMNDFAPHPSDRTEEQNPILRLQHRASDDAICAQKVMIPRKLAEQPNARLADGNHYLLLHEKLVPATPADDLWLAHFPVRSAAQLAIKVIQLELQRLAAGSAMEGMNQHYRRHYLRMAGSPRTYVTDPGIYLRGERFAPASYWGGPLLYSSPLGDWERAAAALLPFIEKLAGEVGLARDTVVKPNRLQRAWRKLTRFGNRLPEPEGDGLRIGLPAPPDSRQNHYLGCVIEIDEVNWLAEAVLLRVRLHNVGLGLWRHRTPDGVGQVQLGIQLIKEDGTALDKDFFRQPLPVDVESGAHVDLHVEVPMPGRPFGTIALDMVSEHVCWFGYGDGIVSRPESHRAAA